jgi:ABC-2 type transport system ATP-binding protein
VKYATLVVLSVVVFGAAACSSSSHSDAHGTTTTTSHAVHPAAKCVSANDPPVAAARVAGSRSDYNLVSFDGTHIRIHWFPLKLAPGATAPTVLKGPGWGLAGDTNTSGSGYGLFGDLSIHTLQAAGYNVLTWDPRGFGASQGTIEVDSPQFEGRDVQRIIDWVARQPGVQLDGPGDPRLGMVGASYGGGIQLVTAAIDCRVDAIVPQIAWYSLGDALYPSDTAKQGWADILYAAAANRSRDPHITHAHEQSDATGTVSNADIQWFLDRGPAGTLVQKVAVPTLFEQGTIDTLFPLREAVANFDVLRANDVPTAMLWMCSGHGVCLTPPGNVNVPGQAAINWLDRYVKRDTNTPTQPLLEYVDQNGHTYESSIFPPTAGPSIGATGKGTLTLVATGGSGPAHPTGNAGALGGVALPITPAKATHAVNVPITVTHAANVVGAPQVTLTYEGSAPSGIRPTRVFAQLVDDTTGIVLGNQITPIALTLDGTSHTTTVPLEIVAFTAKPGAHLTLQLVATTTGYALPRLGGTVTFNAILVQLPTATGVTRT